MNSFDLTRNLTHASVGFIVYSAYDTFVEGKDFQNYAIYDAGAFALASIGSLWTADLLNGVWGYNKDSIQGMIGKPMLTGIFYMYLYDYMVKPNNQRVSSRSGTEVFIMGSLAEVITNYLENPLSGLFGYHNY